VLTSSFSIIAKLSVHTVEAVEQIMKTMSKYVRLAKAKVKSSNASKSLPAWFSSSNNSAISALGPEKLKLALVTYAKVTP